MLGKKYGGDEEIGKAFKLRRREGEHSWILQVQVYGEGDILGQQGGCIKSRRVIHAWEEMHVSHISIIE